MKIKGCIVLLLLGLLTLRVSAYSVLTHEAIIDAAWEPSVKPFLLKTYPLATPDELREAHAYAYGGSIMPDMGYYPLGSKLFTDLVHYVRSGDFVETLLSEASSLNELAFALGALAHYQADIYGHTLGTNQAVPLSFPKIKKKYGHVVNYAQHPVAHTRTEFGFDIVQLAKGNYAPESYRDFIGFKVSKELLERAFLKTYGLELTEIIPNPELSIGSFRWAVKNLLPELTRAAWINKKDEIQESMPGVTARQFRYRMSRASFHKEWGNAYEKPSFTERTLSFIIRIIPKIGPLQVLKFKPPTPEGEKLFFDSFNKTMAQYSASVSKLSQGTLNLQNSDFDTGNPTVPGEYILADEAYEALLLKLEENNFIHTGKELKNNILAFYRDPGAVSSREDKEDREKALKALEKLKSHQINLN